MAIELPTFADTYCRIGYVCASIAEESSASLASEPVDLTASYKASPGKALVRVIWNHNDRNHLHVDFALREAFGKTPPKASARIAEFHKTMKRFHGLSAHGTVSGAFLIPLSSLPPAGGLVFVGKSGIRLRADKSEIELTGASLVFRNAALNRLRWDLGKEFVQLEASAERDLTINDSYLVDAFRELDAAVGRYILGKKAEVQDGG